MRALQTPANYSFCEVIRRPPVPRWSFSVLRAHAERLKSENIIVRSISQSHFILREHAPFNSQSAIFLCGKTHLLTRVIFGALNLDSALLHLFLLTLTCHQKNRTKPLSASKKDVVRARQLNLSQLFKKIWSRSWSFLHSIKKNKKQLAKI